MPGGFGTSLSEDDEESLVHVRRDALHGDPSQLKTTARGVFAPPPHQYFTASTSRALPSLPSGERLYPSLPPSAALERSTLVGTVASTSPKRGQISPARKVVSSRNRTMRLPEEKARKSDHRKLADARSSRIPARKVGRLLTPHGFKFDNP